MQLNPRFLFPCLLTVIFLCLPLNLRADEASGTFTGKVGLRGNYYWETSTRVLAPEVALTVQTPVGLDLSGSYLVDAITSASLAAGVVADIRFTEIRHQGTLGVGKEFSWGDAALRLDLSGKISSEPDYLSGSGDLSMKLMLNEKSTDLGLSLSYTHDEVGSVLRGANRSTDAGDLSNRGIVGLLNGYSLGVRFGQLLSPTVQVQVGYDLLFNTGFLSNPYRGVMVQGLIRPETHPNQRIRHSASLRLAWVLPQTKSALHFMYRAYIDDWGVGALTPELRFYQEVRDELTLRFRYRFYGQSQSFFYRSQELYTAEDTLISADPKMSQFESHLLGIHARLKLSFLKGSFLESASLDANFDYLFQNNRFGNAIISQVGLEVPY